jgi:DNA-binding IclR family transcriptional regulator
MTDSATQGNERYAAPALKKGLQIIEALADRDTGLSLTEIAKTLNYTVNEIFRMVVALQQQGYIEPGADEKYRLTLKIFEVAHRQQPLRSVVATALPTMRDLANQQAQSCHLAVHYDGRVMIVAQVDSPEPWTFNVKVGSVVGLLDTSSGLVMLAYSDPQTRMRMLQAHVAQGGMPPDLEQTLAAIRADGFLIRPSLQTAGVTNLACPVFGGDNHVAAALVVPYVARLDIGTGPGIAATCAALQASCARISKLMGRRDGED